ncbi:MAG: ketosteroid isomerase [Conexibacter sp.]|nr:ketosteroid isomerase [Conexibacter sp.]
MSPRPPSRPSTMTSERIRVVRQLFGAWETGDRGALERVLADDFRFFSPNDEAGLDRDGYFATCWPHREHAGKGFRFVRTIEAGDEVVVTYEAEKPDGSAFRNTEVLTVRDGRVTGVEVYFGWNLVGS